MIWSGGGGEGNIGPDFFAVFIMKIKNGGNQPFSVDSSRDTTCNVKRDKLKGRRKT